MAKSNMYKLSLLMLMLVETIIAQDNPYITQIDPCMQPCLNEIVSSTCGGNADDWECVCTSLDFAERVESFLQSGIECIGAAINCGIDVATAAFGDALNICTSQVIPSDGQTASASVSSTPYSTSSYVEVSSSSTPYTTSSYVPVSSSSTPYTTSSYVPVSSSSTAYTASSYVPVSSSSTAYSTSSYAMDFSSSTPFSASSTPSYSTYFTPFSVSAATYSYSSAAVATVTSFITRPIQSGGPASATSSAPAIESTNDASSIERYHAVTIGWLAMLLAVFA